jgi:conjugative transposon TraN protein
MKKYSNYLLIGMFLLSFTLTTRAQDFEGVVQTRVLVPYKMSISYNKTSNLIFPYSIKSVDRGSADVLIQKANGVENILQVKAAQHDFENTNLSVVTSDGRFYSFLVSYAANPAALNIVLDDDTAEAFLSDTPMNDVKLNSLAEQIKNQPTFLNKKMLNQKMHLALKSIYLIGDAMWFNLHLKNKSLIGYTPYSTRFIIRDKRRSKRSAIQEIELQPIYTQDRLLINGREEINYIYGIPQFTIPTTQELIIQIYEQNGGRTLILPINHRTILKARLPEN